jgi:hypothetical protein
VIVWSVVKQNDAALQFYEYAGAKYQNDLCAFNSAAGQLTMTVKTKRVLLPRETAKAKTGRTTKSYDGLSSGYSLGLP